MLILGPDWNIFILQVNKPEAIYKNTEKSNF